jgi:hypothetical protein
MIWTAYIMVRNVRTQVLNGNIFTLLRLYIISDQSDEMSLNDATRQCICLQIIFFSGTHGRLPFDTLV